MIPETIARLRWSLSCLFLKDGSWDMGAVLVGGLFPWSGRWMLVDDRGYIRFFATYKELLNYHFPQNQQRTVPTQEGE